MNGFYQEIQPGRRLARYVECYWSREEEQGTPNHSVLPDGCVDILFTTQNREPAGLALVGLMTTPSAVDIPRGRGFFGVRFRPGMAAAFMPEAAQLNDRTEPLETIWGKTARVISGRLAESPSPKLMAEIMEGVLRPLDPPDSAGRALGRLADMTVPLNCLASDAGLSERHFRRACAERAGVPPKYLRRILRFRRATDRLSAIRRNAAQPDWAQFAAACGYYDQAHLIREFHEFAGCTPGRFVQSQARAGNLQSEHDEPAKTRKSD